MEASLALLPILWLIAALSVLRLKAYQAALSALAVGLAVSLAAFRTGLPPAGMPAAVWGGVAFALHPICLVILAALFTYAVTVASGAMATIRAGLAEITDDRRVQALIIVWGFGNFMEGMAGFGTAVAIPTAILVGVGFDPLKAVLMCLVANTTPTAFGSVGVPLATLAAKSGVEGAALSWTAAWLQSAVTAAGPVMILLVLDGFRALRGMAVHVILAEIAFLAPSLLAARYLGWELPDILGGLATIVALGAYALRGRRPAGFGRLCRAALPFVFVVLILGAAAFAPPAFRRSPGLLVLLAGFLGGLVQRLPPVRLVQILWRTAVDYRAAFVTTCAVLALARVMGDSGMILALAQALVAATGSAYPFVAAGVGALGGFVTGSGTSSCALFGELQANAAEALTVSPTVLAAANVMGAGIGKMICPQSIAIGAAAAGLAGRESQILKKAAPWFVLVAGTACLVTGLAVRWA